jgi:hypothetical protein
MRGMSARRLPWVVLGVVLAAGFFYWASHHPTIETGRADSTANGGGSIITGGWTYAFYSDMAWTDAHDAYHDNGLPECLPPLSSVEDVRFAWVEVSVEGSTWRHVVWIDCRSVPQP